MTAHTVEHWLADVIGLDANTIGSRALADAVKRRMTACGSMDESDYMDRLNSAQDELSALIEMIVVPETWFFRDHEPFVFLARFVSEIWRAAHPHDLLKVLSIPCSSGEEPYSIAMTLQSAGLPPARYRIDAVDINPSLLHRAEKGDYGSNSFRSGLPAYSERFFKHENTVRTVSTGARAGIRFVHGNIMNLPRPIAEQTYDIIFCRNLLIYQNADARLHIIATLDRLLTSCGMLFVGHAEMMSLLTDRYEPVRHSGTFAYGRKKTGQCGAVFESNAARIHGAGPVSANCVKRSMGLGGDCMPLSAVQEPAYKMSPEHRIDRIRVLADQGRLDDAEVICRDLLKEDPQRAEAHFLLGLIRIAGGQAQAAEECLNRTLYLDADYYEALVHLSLLKAQRGDEAGAERLRRHAGRIRDSTEVHA